MGPIRNLTKFIFYDLKNVDFLACASLIKESICTISRRSNLLTLWSGRARKLVVESCFRYDFTWCLPSEMRCNGANLLLGMRQRKFRLVSIVFFEKENCYTDCTETTRNCITINLKSTTFRLTNVFKSIFVTGDR